MKQMQFLLSQHHRSSDKIYDGKTLNHRRTDLRGLDQKRKISKVSDGITYEYDDISYDESLVKTV